MSRKSVIEAVFGIDGATGVDQLCASIFLKAVIPTAYCAGVAAGGRSRALCQRFAGDAPRA